MRVAMVGEKTGDGQSFADTEVRKNAVQDSLVVDPAGDITERIEHGPEVAGEQFGGAIS